MTSWHSDIDRWGAVHKLRHTNMDHFQHSPTPLSRFSPLSPYLYHRMSHFDQDPHPHLLRRDVIYGRLLTSWRCPMTSWHCKMTSSQSWHCQVPLLWVWKMMMAYRYLIQKVQTMLIHVTIVILEKSEQLLLWAWLQYGAAVRGLNLLIVSLSNIDVSFALKLQVKRYIPIQMCICNTYR